MTLSEERTAQDNEQNMEPDTIVSEERIRQIYTQLRHMGCLCRIGDVLTTLTDAELETFYDDFVGLYGEVLALGALERSEWVSQTFTISANQESIHIVRTSLDAMRSEMERRGIALPTPSDILN
jgi:hypothetical protein